MAQHLVNYLIANDLFDRNQYGFVPKRSTCSQLLTMTQDWASFINRKTSFHCIYFDQKNAFDKIQHSLLLKKMTAIGIHKQTVAWCSSYLANRSFKLKLDYHLSQSFAAPTGVPQGSCLSPILFNIFICDIRNFVPAGVSYLVYADHLKVYCPIISQNSFMLLQSAIDGVAKWCKSNGMLLSPTKCVVLKYGHPEVNYTLNGSVLSTSEFTRDLGIIMSPRLDFSNHIAHIIKSASVMINTIFRCFTITDPFVYIHLFKSLIITKFLYCAPVWKPYLSKHKLAITSVRQKFVRRLKWRCKDRVLDIEESAVPCIIRVIEEQDYRALFMLKRADLLHRFFSFNYNTLRSGCTVRPKFPVARTELVNNMFSWRVARWFHENEVPLLLLS